MNERIKQLAEQAGFVLWGNEEWNPGDVVDWGSRYDAQLEKFAELIAQDYDDKTVRITKEEYALFQKLAKVWFHSDPERTGAYFICGEAGEHDFLGLPDSILVCPTMGSNITAIYEKKHVGKSGQ